MVNFGFRRAVLSRIHALKIQRNAEAQRTQRERRVGDNHTRMDTAETEPVVVPTPLGGWLVKSLRSGGCAPLATGLYPSSLRDTPDSGHAPGAKTSGSNVVSQPAE